MIEDWLLLSFLCKFIDSPSSSLVGTLEKEYMHLVSIRSRRLKICLSSKSFLTMSILVYLYDFLLK